MGPGKPRLMTIGFNTEEAWRASLPEGGTVTVTPYKYVSPIKKKMVSLEGTSDPERFETLVKRFKVGGGVYLGRSNEKTLQCEKGSLAYFQGNSHTLALVPMQRAKLEQVEKHCAKFTDVENAAEPPIVWRNGSKRLLLMIGDTMKDIAFDNYRGFKYLVSGTKRYKTFAEMGDCLNASGQPRLTLITPKALISVSHLF